MMEKTTIRKVKIFMSYQKEQIWLEQMAKAGWFLKNLTMGMIYTFYADEPKNMMYEIDRFNLPKKPTVEEIRHKEMFMDMATELGWKEVTHDETLTYYFCKEYKEGDINELYNDEESRKLRGKKFAAYFSKHIKEFTVFETAVAGCGLFIQFFARFMEKDSVFPVAYNWFVLGYVLFCNCMCLVFHKMAKQCGEEMSMSRQEWMEKNNKSLHKCEKKWIFTIRGLNKFLKKQEEQGWILRELSLRKYFFDRKEGSRQVYTMDSKWLTNKRRTAKMEKTFSDRKDWEGLNNDWQIQSLHDAEEKGWTFVCALENRAVIYRGEAESVEPLNDVKYDNSLRGISLIGDYGLFLLICGLVGGVCGFIMGMLGI